MIKATNINKYFNKGRRNEIHVINNTSIELPSLGLVAFLGPSGSGKTTLLNVLGGLDSAKGQIAYDDKVINHYNIKNIDDFRRKNIGYIFQNYLLLLDKTVYENLQISLEMIGVTDLEEIDKRITYALKAVGMYKYRKKEAYALSGGEQQRVSIARALIKNCKILIADEPTGNLDSQNSVEIMNILKSISRKTLILLVTHNANLAHTYCDKIYNIKDGVLSSQSIEEVENIETSDNNIYLHDLEQEDVMTSIGNIKIYYDSKMKNNIRLIINNGNIYIDGSDRIHLSNNSNVSIIDGSKKEITEEKFQFDNSWYIDKAKKKTFKDVCSNIFSSANIFNTSRKNKIFYVMLILIGCILGICVISYSNYKYIDYSSIVYDSNYYELVNDEHKVKDYVGANELWANENVDYLISPFRGSFTYNKKVNFHQIINYNHEGIIVPYDEKINVIYGRAPENEDEIVLSISFINDIIDEAGFSSIFDIFMGDEIYFYDSNRYSVNGTGTFTICGFCDDSQYYGYVLMNKFSHMCFDIKLTSFTVARDYNYEFDKDGNKMYEIAYGRDLEKYDVDKDNLEALIFYDDYANSAVPNMPEAIDVNGVVYSVVGVFKYPYQIKGKTVIVNKLSTSSHIEDKIASFSNTEYEIVSGKNFENKNEIIVPVFSSYKIGDLLYDKVVVGKYIGSTYAMIYQGLSYIQNAQIFQKDTNYLLQTKDLAAVNESLIDFNMHCASTLDLGIKDAMFKDTSTERLVLSIASIALIVVSMIFIYLINRNKISEMSYNIGVYRSLGMSTSKIKGQFLVNVIFTIVCTSLISYTITALLYHEVTVILYNSFQIGYMSLNFNDALIGGAILLVMMIVCGMIPIISLLRKTPSQILTKFDM